MAVDRLMSRVEHWNPERWARPARVPTDQPSAGPESPLAGWAGGTRADLVFGLAQYLANAAADVEGRPRRTVPRLEYAAALTDQLRVLAADLLLAPASEAVLSEAVQAVRDITRFL